MPAPPYPAKPASKLGDLEVALATPAPKPSHTAEALAAKHGVSRATVERAGEYAEAADRLGLSADIVRGNVAATRAEVISVAKTLPKDAPSEKVAEVAAELRKPHVAHNSGQNEWYTPAHIVEAARAAMGSIDLDPASCEVANRVVKAPRFFTAEDDGLAQEWTGNVFLNPPYAQPLLGQFAQALADKRETEEFDQAVVIVNNGTDTAASQTMLERADAVCFLRGRVRFLDHTGEQKLTPLQGQMVLYFGRSRDDFAQAFMALGAVLYGQ